VTLLALMALVAVAAAEDDKDKKKDAKEVVINIVKGDGDEGEENAQYVQKGEKKQAPVNVTVGQSVKWTNDAKFPHTATSKLKDKDKKDVFSTKRLKNGESDTILFDDKLYKALGGKDDEQIEVVYYCRIHGEDHMKSSLKLKPAKKDKDK